MSKNPSTSQEKQVYIYCDMSKKSNFLGEGSYKQVFLGIGKLEKDTNYFCKIYDNNYDTDKNYAVIVYFNYGLDIEIEMKEEINLNKELKKIAPKLYHVVEKNKSNKKKFFITDVCESISSQLEKYIINDYLDLEKFLKYVKKIYFDAYLTIYYTLKQNNKILLDLKFDNLCYINNKVKLLDLDKKYIIDKNDTKNDTINDKIYLTYVNILLLIDTISIVYKKFIEFIGKEIKNTKFLGNENCKIIEKYKIINDNIINLFDNYFTDLIKKNLTIKNINEFQKSFNDNSRHDNKKLLKFFINNYGIRLEKIVHPKSALVYKIDDLDDIIFTQLKKCYNIDENIHEEQVKFENKLAVLKNKYHPILDKIRDIDQQFRLSLVNFFKNPKLLFKDSTINISDFFKLYIKTFGKNKTKYSRRSTRRRSSIKSKSNSKSNSTFKKKINKSI